MHPETQPTGRVIGRASPAMSDLSKLCSGFNSVVESRPEDFPEVDAEWVDNVISGKFHFRFVLRDRGLTAAEDETTHFQAACPVGTGPCPEDCRSINVWGLSQMATEEELLLLCRTFGTVTDVRLLKPLTGEVLGCAAITFEERSSAQRAQSALHRTCLHMKEMRVGWGRDEYAWKSSGDHWFHVWINEGTTGQQLYKGFRRAGAPCTDARVVRESSAEEPLGVGAVAFRTEEELKAIRDALPYSCKTWEKKCPLIPKLKRPLFRSPRSA